MTGDDPLHHSFPPVFRQDARLLVCGSLPGVQSLAAGRYYAHPQNQFWRLMSEVIGRDLPPLPYEQRLDALKDTHIALWDVIGSGRRQGSLDSNIRIEATHDLAWLANQLPALRAIAFNGGKASQIGRRLLNDRPDLAIVDLPSSSPAYTLAFDAKRERWLELSRFL